MPEQAIDREIPQALADISLDVIYFLNADFRIAYSSGREIPLPHWA